MRRFVYVMAVLLAAPPLLYAIGCGGGGGGGGGSPTPTPPFLNLATFQPADVVVGQADFASGASGGGAAGLGHPGGPVAESSLFLADFNQNRVLGFDTIPTTNGASADFVLGQPDFATLTSGTSTTKFHGPWGAHVAGGQLFVPDYTNNRVLIWNGVPAATNVPADVVVGQADFTSNAHGTTASRFWGPVACAVAGTKLIVADQNNNRVLIWNTIPTAPDAAADLVLGQPNFVSGASPFPPSASTLSLPTGLWTDGTRLVVADQGNNRVLIWNTIPTVDQQPADLVVGQTDFAGGGQGTGSQGMDGPAGVGSNGTQLFVADTNNNRVLIYDTFPTSNGAVADRVLGQGNFVHVTANDANQDDVGDGTPSAQTLDGPTGAYVASNNRLIVTDGGNNRVLIYQAP